MFATEAGLRCPGRGFSDKLDGNRSPEAVTMSTIDRPTPATLPPLEAGQRLDRATFHARYEAMPPDTRAELIGGVVHMPSPLRDGHGTHSGISMTWLNLYRRRVPGLRAGENTSILLDENSEVQPDAHLRILEEYGGQSHVNEDDYIIGAPELVVEVGWSSRKTDLGEKFEDYRRTGVLEYVFVGLKPDEVRWFVRRGDQLVPLAPGDDGIFRSEIFAGLWLDPRALYADDIDALFTIVERGKATPEHAAFVAQMDARRRAP
jgi:Uma2 family endonuclease